MLLHSLRLAFRHLSRKKLYSIIIVMSLIVGFTCTSLLVSFLVSETNADSFHKNKDRIFQVYSTEPFGQGGRITYTTPSARDYILNTYPEVENICQIVNLAGSEINIAGESSGSTTNFSAINTISVDTSFFSLFNFPIASGSQAITDNGIMLTSQKAIQLFGTTDLVGRSIIVRTADTTRSVIISAILGKSVDKSHLSFDAIVYHPAFKPADASQAPGGNSYVLLHDPSMAMDLEKKVNSDPKRPTLMAPGEMDYFFEPLANSYFNANNRMPFTKTRSKTFIQVGWVVGGLILFMASFNFINLFMLSLQERRKETGIKKTLGISFGQLIRSSVMETTIYVSISLLLSLGLIYTLIPIFNTSLEANISFSNFSKFNVIWILAFAILLLAFIVIVISSVQQRRTLPVSMMKQTSSKVKFSKLFFTLQFFISITLCVCSVTIIKQMDFIENEPLGFNRDIIQLKSPTRDASSKLVELKKQVLQIAGIEHAALSEGNPVSGNMVVRYELEDGTLFTPYLFQGDEDLLSTLGLTLVAGEIDLSDSTDHLVNETLVKQFNITDPIGAFVPGTRDRITGVVKDFTCASFKQQIPPVLISYKPDASYLLIDYSSADFATLIPGIESVWAKMFPDEHFEYRVIQQDLMKKYSEENTFYKIVIASSITSMIISCFGLFALSWAVTQSRSKEMGIRKVLGASAADVLQLLTAGFAKRLLVAFLLAAPTGYYLMDLWLSRFAFKVTINAWVFLLSGVVLATIAIVTLGLQTVKASFSSPLDEIRE